MCHPGSQASWVTKPLSWAQHRAHTISVWPCTPSPLQAVCRECRSLPVLLLEIKWGCQLLRFLIQWLSYMWWVGWQWDSSCLVWLHKCLHLTFALGSPPASSLPVFVSGVLKFGCSPISLVQWWTVCFRGGNPLSWVWLIMPSSRKGLSLWREKLYLCLTVLPHHILGLIWSLSGAGYHTELLRDLGHHWLLWSKTSFILCVLRVGGASVYLGVLGMRWDYIPQLLWHSLLPAVWPELRQRVCCCSSGNWAPNFELSIWTCVYPSIPAHPLCPFVQLRLLE